MACNYDENGHLYLVSLSLIRGYFKEQYITDRTLLLRVSQTSYLVWASIKSS
jgi:hypothetical protein